MAAEELKATLAFDGTVEWGIPTSGTNTASASFTDGTYTIQLAAATNYKQNDGYLILGKANSTLTLPAFTWKTTKIVVTGRSGASSSVKQNIYVGETAVSTETTGATGVNEYVIAADYQAAGNVYVLKVTSAHNTQIVKIEVYGEGGETISTTKTVYCKAAQAWWKDGSAAVGVYAFADGNVENAAWPGVRMTAVEGENDLWKADIDTAKYEKIIFTRVNASGDIADWGAKTADLTVPADKNLYTITSASAVWGDPGVTGEWSVYAGEEPTPVEAAYYLVGTMNSWQAAEAYKFAPAEAEGEYLLHTTLAENDEIKVIKVEGETTTWYPAEGGNYIVDALHAGEKDIYFRPAGNEAWAEFGGYIWMGENQPAPVADFTNPFTLKFNGTGESGKDASEAFAADVAAIFDAASAPYVESVETATKVFAGRPIADDNSSVKFGTTSAQGAFAFTLAQAIEVDSIIVNATQYGNNAAKVTVNGTEFDLTAGNKKPQDCKITPENAVSAITIAQSGSERIYLRNVRVYPKTQGGDTPVEIVLPVVKLAGSLTSWEEPVLMANAEDSLSASVTLNLGIDHYQLKVVSDDNWLSKAGDGDLYTMHRDWNHVDHLDLINTGDNIKLITDVEGAYTFTWTYADSSLVVTFPAAPAKPNYYLIGDSAFVVDAGATADKAWTPDAIPSFKDTTVLNLKAGMDYIMRLSLEGTWENHRDFRHLTDTAAGLIELPDEFGNHSIGFRLAEAGEVKIVYIAAEGENPEIFKLIGDFYVEPTPNYYIIGEGEAFGKWSFVPVMQDTFLLNDLAAGDYMFRVALENGNWKNTKGYSDLTEKTEGLSANEDNNILFTLAEAGDVAVVYNDTVFRVIGNFYVAPIKYYIAGSMTNWAEEMVELLPLEEKADSLGIAINLEADSLYAFKVVRVQGTDTTWYGNGEEGTMEYGNSTGWWLKGDVDVKLQTTKAGEYQFIFKANENNEISVVIPEPAKKYYAKYAPKWEWSMLTEEEGLWLTDTLVYQGIGININDKADDENNMFYSNTVEEEGVRPIAGAEIDVNDTIYFTFNPADSVVTAVMVGKYIAPDPTVAVMGSMNDWAEEIPFVLSDDKTYASLTVENIGADEYEFKFIINGEWRSNGYTYHRNFPGAAGITENNDQNMIFQADVTGEYTFKWYFANDSLAIIYPEKPEPVLTNGYYLVGIFGGVDAWRVEDLSAEKLFAANPDTEGEYQLSINLAIGDEVKVVYVENDAIVTWYPAEGDNYVIDDHHNGATTIYFRPDYQGGEDWFAGCIYVSPTSTVGFENTAADAKAVKVLKNGILVIEKNNKTYNVMGQMVK